MRLLPLSGLVDHHWPVIHRLLGDAERHVRMLLLDINRLGNVVISLVQIATDRAAVLPLLILLLQHSQIVL